MSFFKKLKKGLKTVGKAYLAYQTGGLSAVATQALSRRSGGRMMAAMPISLSSQYGGGMASVIPASFSMRQALPYVKKYGGKALKAIPYVGTAATIYEAGSDLYQYATGGSKMPAKMARAMGIRKKYRRINPLNIKALRRSIRRIKGAEKTFRTVLQVQGKHHAGIKPKSRGKR